MSIDPNRCTINEAVRWLPVSRPTLTKWVRDLGAPFVKAPAAKGESWIVSVPDLVLWMIETEVEKAMDKVSATTTADGGILKEEAERRAAVAKMISLEIKADKDARAVAPMDFYEDLFVQVVAPIQEFLSQHPNKAAAKIHRKTGADPVVVADILKTMIDKPKNKLAQQTSVSSQQEALLEEIPFNDEEGDE